MRDRLILTEKLYPLLDWEPFLILSALVLLSWFFYKLFLREVSAERHKSLKLHFYRISRHFAITTLLFVIFLVLRELQVEQNWMGRIKPYIALFAILEGIVLFVQTSRVILLQYLFLGSMRTGVPILIVNIYSLAVTIILGIWVVSHIFGVQLGPLLATSAVFSIILGLALQDTLGNIFAGISMQIDKSFEIGDWLEVFTGSAKVVGQVKEITWRSTVLIGWSDEIIVLPNRTVAGSQISNFAATETPILRSQLFRLDYLANAEVVRNLLIESLKQVSEVRTFPKPICFVSETTESWLGLKLVYYIDSYGSQFLIGDKVMSAGLKALQDAGISTALQKLVLQDNTRSPG